MRSLLLALVAALAAGACSDNSSGYPSGGGSSGVPNGSSTSSSGSSGTTSSTSSSGAVDPAEDAGKPKPKPDAGPPGTNPVRILAGNLTSGTQQAYGPEGTRMFQALHPDVALVQELNFGTNSAADIKGWVTDAFGADYTYFREPSGGIPNGVVTRFPILTSGTWDSDAPDRGFAYAKIDAPGGHALWAVSVHLLTANPGARDSDATRLVAELKKVVKNGDYVVIGGDLNTDDRNEPCLTTFEALVDATGAQPADGAGDGDTNASRAKPYDWVLASPDLVAHQVPTVIGTNTFTNGLVFDSRVYKPLADVAPVKLGDSGVTGMQHMAVVKDFKL